MKSLLVLVLAVLLGACRKGDRMPKGEPPASEPAARQSPEGRAFDDRLTGIIDEWLGTPWTFSGTSRTPRQGSIACGYFVTTTLEQAGMELDRVGLAQAASETMILATTPPDSVRRYSNATLEGFLEGVRKQGVGYYIVGLDNHTGFLRVESNGEIAFVHSGPGRGVVREDPDKAPELANSRYRVTGKITPPPPAAKPTLSNPPDLLN